MHVLNFGSLNIDNVYLVPSFVRPGETLASLGFSRFAGGKGANQSIALARAGAKVTHAGLIGEDGVWLKEMLAENGVDTSLVGQVNEPTGHALIQVDKKGENAIILHGGANHAFKPVDIANFLKNFTPDDYLLLQNETNCIQEALIAAQAKGMRIIFNPAPFTNAVKNYPLTEIDHFIINEIEGAGLTQETHPEKILDKMRKTYTKAKVVLTLGANGVWLDTPYGERHFEPAQHVNSIDTTGAGDTFIGYYLANLMQNMLLVNCIKIAVCASAICVTRRGAAASIPKKAEVEAILTSSIKN